MGYIITSLCDGCKDTRCIKVCPVKCIYEYIGDSDDFLKTQLYIDQSECINCGACQPECPWEAIYEEESVPNPLKGAIKLNYKISQSVRSLPVPENKSRPQRENVLKNKQKWGI